TGKRVDGVCRLVVLCCYDKLIMEWGRPENFSTDSHYKKKSTTAGWKKIVPPTTFVPAAVRKSEKILKRSQP
ncbi:hypothetical protein, partial [Kamptonema formosum]|uniref:hypothetical protein n=1 Tax=Kamptonema formosum TaxID=331992 RepID=UPI001E5E4936